MSKLLDAWIMESLLPFCPINNVIPEWNNLVYEKDQIGLKVLHSTNNFMVTVEVVRLMQTAYVKY